MSGDLGFVHRWVPPSTIDTPTLLLLHGTGGDEEDLIGLGMVLAPGAGLLSPRGKVLEAGHPRWFRRLAPGVFDEADVIARARELAAFLRRAAAAYDADPGRIVAVGFSNGANIAAALLLLEPGVLAGAVLFRAQVPLRQAGAGPRTPAHVFLSAGQDDPMVPAADAERLASLLRDRGSAVTLHWVPGGHDLTAGEIEAARAWLAAEAR